MSIKRKIIPKLEKVIRRFPTQVEIFRGMVNEFNEVTNDIRITTVTGFYYEDSVINIGRETKGNTKKEKSKYLILTKNEQSDLIKELDYFYFKNKKYLIRVIDNLNSLDVYYTLILEVVQ